jgi:hypothetical protein
MAIPELLKPFADALVFVILVALFLFFKKLPYRLRSLRGSNWPIVNGTVEAVKVETFAEQSLAELAYSYTIDGERYSGYFLRQFADQQDAWDYVRLLDRQPILVRYKPSAPSISSVRIQEQNPLFVGPEKNFVFRLIHRIFADFFGASDWKGFSVMGAKHWPTITGKIESATISHLNKRHFVLYIPVYIVEVGYSYSVAGEYFAGHFEQTFYREDSAQQFVETWSWRMVSVRYRPASPEISFLYLAEQQSTELPEKQQLV